MENMQIPQSLIDNPVALSVRQPWAWLIVNGYKDVENRKRLKNFRGWVFIHAGLKFEHWVEYILPATTLIKMPRTKSDYLRGGLIGVAKIVDCVTESQSQWFQGPYGVVIEEARPSECIECKGQLGFFKPEISIGGKP